MNTEHLTHLISDLEKYLQDAKIAHQQAGVSFNEIDIFERVRFAVSKEILATFETFLKNALKSTSFYEDLQNFLAAVWHEIQGSFCGYTDAPEHYITQLFLKVVDILVRKDDKVQLETPKAKTLQYWYLMPTLEHLGTADDPFAIGNYALRECILSDNTKSLLPASFLLSSSVWGLGIPAEDSKDLSTPFLEERLTKGERSRLIKYSARCRDIHASSLYQFQKWQVAGHICSFDDLERVVQRYKGHDAQPAVSKQLQKAYAQYCDTAPKFAALLLALNEDEKARYYLLEACRPNLSRILSTELFSVEPASFTRIRKGLKDGLDAYLPQCLKWNEGKLSYFLKTQDDSAFRQVLEAMRDTLSTENKPPRSLNVLLRVLSERQCAVFWEVLHDQLPAFLGTWRDVYKALTSWPGKERQEVILQAVQPQSSPYLNRLRCEIKLSALMQACHPSLQIALLDSLTPEQFDFCLGKEPELAKAVSSALQSGQEQPLENTTEFPTYMQQDKQGLIEAFLGSTILYSSQVYHTIMNTPENPVGMSTLKKSNQIDTDTSMKCDAKEQSPQEIAEQKLRAELENILRAKKQAISSVRFFQKCWKSSRLTRQEAAKLILQSLNGENISREDLMGCKKTIPRFYSMFSETYRLSSLETTHSEFLRPASFNV